MPANPTAAKNMLMSTDYPLDKVVYQRKYIAPIAAFSPGNFQFAHGLGFAPLLDGRWSTDPTMATTYNLNSGPRHADNSVLYQTSIEADDTYVYINTINQTGSSVTLYFTIYGLMPSNVDMEAPSTAFTGDAFTLNTDYNYTKLYTSGAQAISAGTNTVNIAHNLGYYPQVSIWKEQSGLVEPWWGSGVFVAAPSDMVIKITTTNLVIESNGTFFDSVIHYRIYVDEQA